MRLVKTKLGLKEIACGPNERFPESISGFLGKANMADTQTGTARF